MPKMRLPAIADRAVCDKVSKGRAGIRWDSVVEKVWKDKGGSQERILLSIDKVWGVQDRSKRGYRNKAKYYE